MILYTKNIIVFLIILSVSAISVTPAEMQSSPAGRTSTSSPEPPVQLSRLGSRLTIIPEPDRNRIRVLPIGHCFTEFSGLTLTVTADKKTTLCPSCNPNESSQINRTLTPTSIAYSIPVPGTPMDQPALLEYRLVSPLTPNIQRWRTAPVMLAELTLTNPGPIAVTCQVSLSGLTNQLHKVETANNAILLSTPLSIPIDQQSVVNYEIRDYLAPQLRSTPAKQSGTTGFSSVINGTFTMIAQRDDGWLAELKLGTGRLTSTLTAQAGQSARTVCAITFHTNSPVLSIDGNLCPFAYTADFNNASDLAEAALRHAQDLLETDARTCRILGGPSQFEAAIAYEALRQIALQSFLSNTWLVRQPDGSTRYSEWEGFPLFHSTLDVVFNTSLFHLAFAPDLLADMLMHWPLYHQDGDMPHDMGKGLVIDRNAYPVRMTVEENANYLLLHAMLAARTGNNATAAAQRDTIDRLVRRLIASDTDSDTLPDTGVINTFDDAPPSVNSAPNQIYLGIKTAAALQAAAQVLSTVLSKNTCAHALNRSQLIFKTIERSWTGTLFPIALPAPQSTAPEQGKVTGVLLPLDHDKPINTSNGNEDPNGYCNYAAHGLVALWLCGLSAPVDLETRMRFHLESAHEKTQTGYGDSHRDGHANVWISQNMWRDLAALYLGADIDYHRQHAKYLKLQVESVTHRTGNCRWEGFCDSPENSFLTCYSRGIPILAFPWFQQGLIDLPEALPRETDFR
ncbi:hypothetical protein JW823_04905 [bacterium]|nr:hypothetical protein [candidate division CSSED10-310 bacterium]